MKRSLPLRATLLSLFLLVGLTAVLLALIIIRILQAQIDQATYISLSTLVVGMLTLSVVVGIIVVLMTTKYLQKVKNEAVRFANGDLSRKIDITSNDEVGQLGTAFNQMAERLRDSYQRLALENRQNEILLESMSEGMIAIDTEGKIVLINGKAVAMLDLKRRDAMGKDIVKLTTFYLPDQQNKEVAATSRPESRALHGTRIQSGIYGFRKKTGKTIQINIDATPVIAEGKRSGAVIILRDVTHEREVDRMKTEFISLASHQLRTPLSAIKWFTEMLVSGDAGKLTPEQQDFAQNIYNSSERMIELVSSLLNISRIESGRIIIDPRPTDLSELIGGIINDLKAKIEQRHQTLIISVHKALPKVNLDPHLVGQVYLNLLSNAIKYTPKGGEISVIVSRRGKDIVSQITDNGYGIPKAQQDKVFQKFFRAENAVKVETDGTGLGLYLIKAVVESSGGKIWFESEEGKGTTFWFSLPMSGMKPKAGEVTLDM